MTNTNTCEQCIVRAMCLDPCDEMIRSFQFMLESIDSLDYNLYGTPIIYPGFAKDMCILIRKKPNTNLEIGIEYETVEVDYTIHVKNGSVIDLVKKE